MTPSEYQNPILCADYSDPDIVRVGDDFFMVSSSFNHVPALPILHSTDLVNWTIINHVMDELPLPGYDRYQPGKGRMGAVDSLARWQAVGLLQHAR
ncbi:putative glycoside hydrolase [Klebsiella pneumoniae]|uniref:Putative glycoside hydrolase n=1 Tax=Klebsiella pneumoniae TaxID=573 RepID=A0A4P0YGR1_KLEPN|nr:putative glycoside hydrolase [Klebsiella pneumoniae]